MNVDCTDNSDFKRLYQLDTATWLNATRCVSDNIDVAYDRPNQCEKKQPSDRDANRAANGRRRCFDDFKRGRQKGEFVLLTTLAESEEKV